MREMNDPQATIPSTQRAGVLHLATTRLVLRDWTPADIPDLIEGLNDLRVSRWLAFVPHPYTQADAERWLAYCTQLPEQGAEREQYEFAIEVASAQKVIGGASLTRVSRLHGTAGGGIWINARYHGQGYGSEAFGEKIRFAFVDLQLRRLENGFFKGNAASFAMQQRFGYQLEGERRQAYRCLADGTLKDECITGLLKAEWNRGYCASV
jgi:ribosomal-protein-alanine N-acetyltransferase